MITVESVSDDGVESRITVPREVLAEAGDYFQKCLDANMKEARTGPIKIQGIIGDRTLERFFWWLNYGHFQFGLFRECDSLEEKTTEEDTQLAVDMAIFGERIQNVALQKRGYGRLS